MLTNGPEELYSAEYDFSQRECAPNCRIMIATLPRTGSSQLGIQLWQTGAAGAPLEYLNLAFRVHDMVPRLGNGSFLHYWERLEKCRTSANGVFSFKAFISDLDQMAAAAPELRPSIRSDYTIYLTRRDKLAQAVSWARARQTGKWFSLGVNRTSPVYSREEIELGLNALKKYESLWEALFEKTECPPVRLFYEDFISDPEAIVGETLSLLSIDQTLSVRMHIPNLQIQRDDLSAEWIDRYLRGDT